MLSYIIDNFLVEAVSFIHTSFWPCHEDKLVSEFKQGTT